MASLVLSGDTSGSITVAAPAVAGSNTQTLAAVTGTLAPIVSGTAVTASGTSVDFTGIPSWAKRITVMFSGVSTSGTSFPQVQLGDSGGVETTGYTAQAFQFSSVNNGNSATTGFIINSANASASRFGHLTLTLMSTNLWVCSAVTTDTNLGYTFLTAGSKTLSDTLDRVRITTVNGTDTFDAGTINLLWE